jgi:hypothetical protein
MNDRLSRLIPLGALMAVSIAAAGCAAPDDDYGYYGPPESEYDGPAYAAPPGVYYQAPPYRDYRWRHGYDDD